MGNITAVNEANDASRQRLRALLAGMRDEDLETPLDEGWTAAAMLTHMALYDFRLVAIVERWEAGAEVADSPFDVHVINDAKKPICLAVPRRAAAALALVAAEAADAAVEGLVAKGPEWLEGAARFIRLDRAHHRVEHMAQIEAALAGRSGVA